MLQSSECIPGDPSSIQTHESYKYVGEYQGEYTTNTEHVYVGNGSLAIAQLSCVEC